ncbi:MAG: hypothetical protein ACXU8Z_04355 [Caulobacteraceae bacterium]
MALEPAALANPAKRVEAFRRLPDWSGLWISTAEKPNLAGQYDDISVFTLGFGHPPYNPTWEARYQAIVNSGPASAHPVGESKSCDMDFPAVMQYPQPFQLTVTPEETLLTVGDGAIRHIYTDRRRHPPADELTPSRMGDSIGHWEGDVLVVDTIGRRPGQVLLGVISFSEAAHFVERIRKTGRDKMEDQIVIEDPVALTKPWRLTLGFNRVTYLDRIVPYECDATDRIRIVDGKGEIVPAAH